MALGNKLKEKRFMDKHTTYGENENINTQHTVLRVLCYDNSIVNVINGKSQWEDINIIKAKCWSTSWYKTRVNHQDHFNENQ